MDKLPAGERERLGAELALLAGIVGVETVCAVKAFPQMDDAYLMLLLKERGAAAVGAAHRDRPLVGSLWQSLAELSGDGFWKAGFLAHFALWFALGIIACRLWRRLFPGWERYAVVVGAVAVAPIIVRTQFSTVTISLLGVLSVVPVWASVFLTWRFADTGRPALLAVAFVLAAGGALLSEYGVVAGISGAALLAFAPSTGNPKSRARARWAGAGLGALAVACYGVYVRMGDFSSRPLVDPARQIGRVGLVTRAPLNVMTRFWDAVVGDLCRAAAGLQLEWQSKSSLLALVLGALVGAALWLAAGRKPDGPAPEYGRRAGIVALAGALLVGLLPIALMRPVFHSAFASRFAIPILPLAASLSVALVLSLVQGRFQRLAAAGFGLLVGIATAREAGDALRQRSAMASVAALLEPVVRMHPGLTLAVLSDPGLCYTAQVCTGAMTRDWAPAFGRRLWVETAEEARASLGGRGACAGSALAGLSERGFEREPASGPPIWVELGDRPARLESYCVATGDRRAAGTEENR
jgi:hypothetical protein